MHHHPANPFRSVRKMLQAQTIRTRHLPTRRENYSSQPRPAIHAGMIGSLASKSFYVHRSRAKRLMQQKACHDGIHDSPRKNGLILGRLGKPIHGSRDEMIKIDLTDWISRLRNEASLAEAGLR